jgi:glyoxylase-like metal-dependent hydrolase (beta-lactamase superfamily II)
MSNTVLIRLAALALSSSGLWVALTQPGNQPLTTEKLADDLHIIVGSGGNVAVLDTPEGVILVDDKFERNVPEILEKVKGMTAQPVKYIVNTHQHGDHTGGNAKLMAAAEVIAHQNARTNMVAGKQPGLPRITFSDRTALFLGGKEVRAIHFGRGHTNGDAVIYFPAHRIIHTGDLFVSGAPFIDYPNGGSGLEWTRTLTNALTLDFDRVIPGHGPVMKREDLVAWIRAFDTVRERMSELKRQGKTKDETANLLKLDDLGTFKPSPGWNQRSFPGFFDEIR